MIDVFKVGVHIGMSTNSAQMLGAMLSQLTGIHVAAGNVTSGLGKLRMAALGAGAAFIGFKGLEVMTHLLEKGVAFNQELAKMKMANYAPSDIKSLEDQSYKTMQAVPGSNLLDNMKGLVDLRNVSGLAEHAVSLSETIGKVNLVLSNVTGKPAEQAGYNFIKFLEDSGRMMDPKTGQFSEERVAHESRWMEAVIAGMNGRVTGDNLFQFRQSGKASVNALSDQGLTNLLPAIQSLGPVATGTAIQGMSQQLLGSVQLYKHTIDWLEQYELLDPNKVVKQKGGRYSLLPGAITGESQLQSDKMGWIWDVLSTHLKHKDGTAMTPQEKVNEIMRSGLRVTAQGLMTEGVQNEVTQKKEVGNVKRSNEIDQFEVMNKESPTFRITKFHEAWTNLQIALGKTVDVTMFLVPITDALNALNAAAVAHPDAARHLIELAGGLSAVTALSGSLVVLNLCWKPLAAGLSLLTGVPALAGTGAAITALGIGIAGLAAVFATPAVIAMLAKLGSDAETPENRAKIEQNRKDRGSGMMPDTNDGFGPDGRPSSSYVAPPASTAGEKHSGNVYLDGKKVGMILDNHSADRLSRPSRGTNAPDLRVSPAMPGLAWNMG